MSSFPADFKYCTYISTNNYFRSCYTCDMTMPTAGVCDECAKRCHSDHNLGEPVFRPGFACDCNYLGKHKSHGYYKEKCTKCAGVGWHYCIQYHDYRGCIFCNGGKVTCRDCYGNGKVSKMI